MKNLIFGKLKNKDSSSIQKKEIKDSQKEVVDDIFSSLKKETEKKSKSKKKKLTTTEDNSLSGLVLPDNLVAIPHYFSQSSIYAPRSGDRISISKRTDIWAQGDMNVSYDGPPLDTKIDIQLMSLVLKARDLQKSSNNIVKLKFKETMQKLGLNPHHPNSRVKFTSSINRHLEAKLFFSVGNEDAGFWRNFFVSEGTIFDYKKNILHIQISDILPPLFKLKESGSFSIENMLISFAIKGSYSSKLYSYYESNDTPFPVKVSTLLEICDKKISNETKPTNNHRKIIKEALNELLSLSFLENWYFDSTNDKRDPLVVVSKKKKKDRKFDNIKINFKPDYIDGEK